MRLQVRRGGAWPTKLFKDPRRRPRHRVNRCSCTLRDFSPTESHAKSLDVLERKGNSSSGRRGRRLVGLESGHPVLASERSRRMEDC